LISWQSFARNGLARGKLSVDTLAERGAIAMYLLGNRAKDLTEFDVLAVEIARTRRA